VFRTQSRNCELSLIISKALWPPVRTASAAAAEKIVLMLRWLLHPGNDRIKTVFYRRQRFGRLICSYEHESVATSALVAPVAQANRKTSADGIEFMDPTLKTLKASLEAIRDVAMKALTQIEQSREQHSIRWICKQCRYIKQFTTPVVLETVGRCPRCKSIEFRPVL